MEAPAPVIPGSRFGKWTVLEEKGVNQFRCKLSLCRCDCGRESIVKNTDLRSGHSKQCISCGAKQPKKVKTPKSLMGRVFGKLEVISEGFGEGKDLKSTCRCSCGTIFDTRNYSLIKGGVSQCKDCANLRSKEAHTTHGKKETDEYKIWTGMKRRCDPKNAGTSRGENYAGRGISVCSEWNIPDGFEAFLRDMGPRPSKLHSIDRKDNDGNYCKENCRWATRQEQNLNSRHNVVLTVDGVSHTTSEWASIAGILYDTLRSRLRRGWSHKDSVFGRDGS